MNLNYKYISFDIFDTLIVRNVSKPSDIFEIVEREYNLKYKNKIKNFKKQRILAETKARKQNFEEVTINQIYENLISIYSKEICLILENIEKETEIKYCQLTNNLDVLNIYNNALKNKKKIIITSDMYLEEVTIKKILKNANIHYDKLYLSSKINKTKVTGNLYKYILNDLNITYNDILHIGNNLKSDYKTPKKNKIKSILIKNSNINIYPSLSINILNSFIKNNIINTNYYEDFGYKNFGPILYSFCKYLYDELEKNNINKVYFLSRDGFIIKNAFDTINNNKNIKSYYMYASRRSLIVPSFIKYSNSNEIISSMKLPKKITINNLNKKLGIENKNFNNSEKYDLQSKFIKNYIDKNMDIIKKNAQEEYNNLIKYLNKINFKDKVAIVDIGWYGNMQKSLCNLFPNVDIYGYYIGVKNNLKDININGYLFDNKHNNKIRKTIDQSNALFEFIFLTQHGSVKKFLNNKVEFFEYEYKNRKEESISKMIHNGALNFVNDFNNKNLMFDYYNSENCFYNMEIFLNNPSNKDVKKFYNINFYDNNFNKIIDFKYKYIFNLKKLYIKFKYSGWKIGYLKKIFKLDINYKKLYNILYKIKHK